MKEVCIIYIIGIEPMTFSASPSLFLLIVPGSCKRLGIIGPFSYALFKCFVLLSHALIKCLVLPIDQLNRLK